MCCGYKCNVHCEDNKWIQTDNQPSFIQQNVSTFISPTTVAPPKIDFVFPQFAYPSWNIYYLRIDFTVTPTALSLSLDIYPL